MTIEANNNNIRNRTWRWDKETKGGGKGSLLTNKSGDGGGGGGGDTIIRAQVAIVYYFQT